MKLLSNRRRQCFRRFIDGVGGCKKAQKLIETIRMTSKKKQNVRMDVVLATDKMEEQFVFAHAIFLAFRRYYAK